MKEFNCNEDLIDLMEEARVNFEQHGAALEFKKEGEEEVALTILCSSNTNYKILMICAYFMEQHGQKVAVLRESDALPPLVAFLR